MRTIAELDVQAGERIDARAIVIEEARIQADAIADQRKDLQLRHVSWRFTITTVSPVLFAILVAIFMFLFWKWKQPEAAGAFEKILVMVITGGLGWAAGRTQGGGFARAADRAPVPKQRDDGPSASRAAPSD